ncbi:MAG: trehalase family glycosidase [Gemmatimonadota bacterium]
MADPSPPLAPPAIPDIWGEGALFAFSGLDGPTCSASGFVATYASEPFGLLIHTPRRRVLSARLPAGAQARVRAATGAVLLVESDQGELAMGWTAWHSLAGRAPADACLGLRLEGSEPQPASGGIWCTVDEGRDAVVLAADGGRFGLAWAPDAAQALDRARQALAADLPAEVGRRLAFLSRAPRLGDPGRDRLLRKALSVMKVNTLAAEGAIPCLWSTPDRVPHRHLWLWDSVFHSFGMNWVDADAAWHFLEAVLACQNPDGMISHMMQVDGGRSSITQPPILAWGVWENQRRAPDRQRLEWAYPRLAAYLEWNLRHRDRNHNDLLEWEISGEPRCRSGESGMDNSPRFDAAAVVDAVDFSAFQAVDMGCLARLAAELGRADEAARWGERRRRLARQIQDLLWDEAAGLYTDRDLAGRLTGVKAVSGFLPLLLDEVPAGRVEALARHTRAPRTFGAAFPLPSVALDEPAFSTDMWRGATWVNLDWLVVQGFRRQGRPEVAARLTGQVLAHVDRHYREWGVLFEFYDAADRRPPAACDRKGPRQEPYDLRRKVDSIRDYHWTASLVADLLLAEAH